MFGFFKRILRKLGGKPQQSEPATCVPDAEFAETPVTNLISSSQTRLQSSNGNGHARHGKGIELPLQSILHGLPLELQPLVKWASVGQATVTIPVERILPQLSRGTVKISFGELRQAAPQLFGDSAERDQFQVTLPLAEVLSRLNPALITRKRAQKQIEVPQEISSPFDSRGGGLKVALEQAKDEARAASAGFQVNSPGPAAMPPTRGTLTSTPTLPPPGTPVPVTPILTPARATRSEPDVIIAKTQPSVESEAKPAAQPLMVGLTTLAEAWPEAVRQEIVHLKLVDAKVGLPTEAIERALKQGRIAFTWKNLRSWIKPAAQPTVSAHDGAILELPLKIVAPLFLARQNEAAKGKQKLEIDEKIPNLFFGFPQPEPAGVAAAPLPSPAPIKSNDSNFYVWDDCSDTVRFDETAVKRAPMPGTDFVTKYATPNEVVSRAAALDCVAGALIALPDGLMVASQLSGELNGDTLAAFLPQIFGKVSQCTKELRMGELNNINFTVGNVPWKIFRVNAIFFAAFGRAGEALPTADLAALAAELDHKPK